MTRMVPLTITIMLGYDGIASATFWSCYKHFIRWCYWSFHFKNYWLIQYCFNGILFHRTGTGVSIVISWLYLDPMSSSVQRRNLFLLLIHWYYITLDWWWWCSTATFHCIQVHSFTVPVSIRRWRLRMGRVLLLPQVHLGSVTRWWWYYSVPVSDAGPSVDISCTSSGPTVYFHLLLSSSKREGSTIASAVLLLFFPIHVHRFSNRSLTWEGSMSIQWQLRMRWLLQHCCSCQQQLFDSIQDLSLYNDPISIPTVLVTRQVKSSIDSIKPHVLRNRCFDSQFKYI